MVPTDEKGNGCSPIPFHQDDKVRGAKGTKKLASKTERQARRVTACERAEGEDKVGPDTQRRHEDEGATRAPCKSLRPFRNQRPDLRGKQRRNRRHGGCQSWGTKPLRLPQGPRYMLTPLCSRIQCGHVPATWVTMATRGRKRNGARYKARSTPPIIITKAMKETTTNA